MFTRTKRAFWGVVSDRSAFEEAAVKPAPYRCENLARRLIKELPNLKPCTIIANIPALEMNGDIPNIPLEAMDNGFDPDDF